MASGMYGIICGVFGEGGAIVEGSQHACAERALVHLESLSSTEAVKQLFYEHPGGLNASPLLMLCLYSTGFPQLAARMVERSKEDPLRRNIAALVSDGNIFPLSIATIRNDSVALFQLLIREYPPALTIAVGDGSWTSLQGAESLVRSDAVLSLLRSCTAAYEKRNYQALARLCGPSDFISAEIDKIARPRIPLLVHLRRSAAAHAQECALARFFRVRDGDGAILRQVAKFL